MKSRPLEVTERRSANYTLAKIADRFEPCNFPESSCANIKWNCEEGLEWEETLGGTTSAPYALARLCALFPGLRIETYGQEGYKVTWQLALKHKASGQSVTFYDYKSGISYGSDLTDHKNPPADFITDVKKLIEVLANDRCPHPYDGCVVGEPA